MQPWITSCTAQKDCVAKTKRVKLLEHALKQILVDLGEYEERGLVKPGAAAYTAEKLRKMDIVLDE